MNLKILKLRSGEEIACQVVNETENHMLIFQPMIFKTSSTYDPMGRLVDVITLHDWLVNTDNKEVELPKNHVAFISTPSKQTTNLYETESLKEFKPKNLDTNNEKNHMDMPDDMLAISEILNDLLNNTSNIMEAIDPPPTKSKRRKKGKTKFNLPPDMTDEKELDRHMIMMQLYIPAESIMNLITSGIIEPNVLLDMVNEVKKRNRFTGDEKNRKDFGNNFSDWNPDPNSKDYE